MKTIEWLDYNNQVIDYLEYIGYPEYITMFEPIDVAETLAKANAIFFRNGLSYRMAALINFGLTMTMQVMPTINDSTKQ